MRLLGGAVRFGLGWRLAGIRLFRLVVGPRDPPSGASRPERPAGQPRRGTAASRSTAAPDAPVATVGHAQPADRESRQRTRVRFPPIAAEAVAGMIPCIPLRVASGLDAGAGPPSCVDQQRASGNAARGVTICISVMPRAALPCMHSRAPRYGRRPVRLTTTCRNHYCGKLPAAGDWSRAADYLLSRRPRTVRHKPMRVSASNLICKTNASATTPGRFAFRAPSARRRIAASSPKRFRWWCRRSRGPGTARAGVHGRAACRPAAGPTTPGRWPCARPASR